jgi:hypothetical protein
LKYQEAFSQEHVMGLAVLALGATGAAAYLARNSEWHGRPTHLDPYTVWMMSHLPNGRAWHR